jgi:hypothetical protein
MRQDVTESEGEYERIQQTRGRSGENKKSKIAFKQRRSKRKEKRRITRDVRRKGSRHGIFPLWNSGRESGLKCSSPRVLGFLCIYAR